MMASIYCQNRLLQDQLSALNQETNITAPIPLINNDMANNDEPLPICGRVGTCHYQVPTVDDISVPCK